MTSSQSKTIQVVAAVAHNKKNQIMLAKRKPMLHCGGLWEFPGGKVEMNEVPARALERELYEEFNIKAHTEDFLGEQIHHYETVSINLMGYWVTLESNEAKLHDHDEMRWFNLDELDTIPLAPADTFLVKIIKTSNFLVSEPFF